MMTDRVHSHTSIQAAMKAAATMKAATTIKAAAVMKAALLELMMMDQVKSNTSIHAVQP